MSITTYAELQTAIANWLVRGDLTSRIPEFIALAEAQLQRDIRHWRMENRATATIDARFSALPDDFLAPVRMQISTSRYPLDLITSDEMHEKRAYAADGTGEPRFYTIIGGEFEFFPTPSGSHTATLTYRQKIPALSDANTSNWLLAFAPDVYLWGSLMQSAPLLQEDERLATWAGLYSSALAGLTMSENDRWSAPMKMKSR